MKRGLLFLVLGLGLVVARTQPLISVQYLYFKHGYTNDLTHDTVSLVMHGVGLPIIGYLSDITVNAENDSVTVRACYHLTGITAQPYLATDTVQLGIFTANIYYTKLYLSATGHLVYDTCNSTNLRDTFDLAFFVITDTGLLDAPAVKPNSTFSLSPNPASTSVTVTAAEGAVNGNITICDITGRTIFQSAIQNPQFEINTANFTNGVYLVTVTGAGGRSGTKRLVINR